MFFNVGGLSLGHCHVKESAKEPKKEWPVQEVGEKRRRTWKPGEEIDSKRESHVALRRLVTPHSFWRGPQMSACSSQGLGRLRNRASPLTESWALTLLRRQSRSCWHVSSLHWALWAEGTVWPCCSEEGKRRRPDGYLSCCRRCLRKRCPSAALITCLVLLAWCSSAAVDGPRTCSLQGWRTCRCWMCPLWVWWWKMPVKWRCLTQELPQSCTCRPPGVMAAHPLLHRACCLLTLTMTCPRPDPPQGPEVRGVWRGALRILQLPGAPDCPLLRVLAGEAAGKEVEGSLPWIISWLLEGNNYSGLLLHLDPQGISLSLLQAALLGASGRRMEVKQVRPTLWDAVEEARACRAGLRTLRLSLLGDNLTDNGLSRLGRALRELQVVKAWSQCPRSQVLKGARDEGLPEPQQVTDSAASHSSGLQGELQVAGRTASLRPGLHQKNTHRDSEEQAQQVPDMALQFFLAQARRQRLREQHKIWIGEKLKHLEQEEEVAGDQVKGLEEACEERQRWHQEQTVLRLQLEALEAQRDAAEQDLAVLYDLHVQATRARTCHMLQVFRAWQRLWKEQAMTTEHQHRSLLAGILQDTINLATQNQELQAQNQQLRQGAD
nr:uncharacterized protein LOC105862530 isoform X2 [Microcebus murinus]